MTEVKGHVAEVLLKESCMAYLILRERGTQMQALF